MEGMTLNAAYIAAILGATLGACSFLYSRRKDARARAEFYKLTNDELNSALISAERALKNGATPDVVRQTLLLMLEAVATPDVGRTFTQLFIQTASKKAKRPGHSNELSAAVDSLHARNPALAADIHKAIMGMILVIPVMYADKIKVDILAVEGATNPESVFDRIAKALGGLRGGGGKNGGTAGGTFAHC